MRASRLVALVLASGCAGAGGSVRGTGAAAPGAHAQVWVPRADALEGTPEGRQVWVPREDASGTSTSSQVWVPREDAGGAEDVPEVWVPRADRPRH